MLLVEYAYNNAQASSTSLSSIFSNYRYNPQTHWTVDTEVKNLAFTIYAHWMEATTERARNALTMTREERSRYYNKCWREKPSFKVRDIVMLYAQNIKTKKPAKKLALKSYRSFKVLRVDQRTC